MKTNFRTKARAAVAVICAAAAMTFAGCRKYDDSAVNNRLDKHERRLAALESAVAALDAQIKSGAMIKSVTPIAEAPGGWRIEFTGGTPSTIDIMNGAAGSNPDLTGVVSPLIEVRTNPDGTVSVWYNVTAGYPASGWTDTGTDIRGPQGGSGGGGTGPQGPAGISPKVRVHPNGNGTVTIQYNVTAGYPAGGWVDAGEAIALDSNPDDRAAILSIVDNAPLGTVTITMNDGDPDAEPAVPNSEYTFAKASGAARFEIMTVRKPELRSSATAQIRFVVNPSDAWIPTDPAKWELNAIDAVATRAGYVEASKHFRVTAIAPAPEAEHKGEYFATIENFGTGADAADYTLDYHVALVLNTGTEAAPVLISSPAFVMGHIGPVASGTDGGITWVLYSDGILSIDGTGPIPDYEGDGTLFSNPWTNDYHLMFESVVISEGITAIGDYAFPSPFSDNPVLRSVVIPASVETIGLCAFANCSYLEQVILPAGLKSIGGEAFYAAGLRSIVIPDKVETIGDYAFQHCLSSTEITLGAGLRSIGVGAFGNCRKVTEITIPAGVETIGERAFTDCEALTSVTCLATDPPTLVGSMNFRQNTADVLQVPAGSVDAYKDNTAWNTAFSGNIVAIQ
ncbi:MAG: leucine-rich repeat domain-containing protein [Alistipes sp.]|jgi:hypothetical protein|nr:leucine-rich repeat domain-containing protein [Alistipes sp.]